jgi:hypothetical protein
MTSAPTVRFRESSLNPTTPLVSSNNAAKAALSTGIQALHAHLRDNEAFTGLADKIIQLFFTLQTKVKTVSKFTDETYIPQSCRVKIELKGSSRMSRNEKFKTLQEDVDAEVKAFQIKMRNHFQKAHYLEIGELRSVLHERIVTFADLLVKQKLLTTNACRVHTQSKELTYKLFEKAPSIDDHDDDDDIEDESDSGDCHMKDIGLDFGCRSNNKMKMLLTIPATQNIVLNETEKDVVLYAKNALKQTLSAAIDAFDKKEEEKKSAKATKEILQLAITGEAADATAIALDEEEVTIPTNMTDLKGMFNQMMVDFHKSTTNESKVKGVRGAQNGTHRASLKNKSGKESKKVKAQKNNHRKKRNESAKRKKQNSAEHAAPDSAKGDKQKKKRTTSKKK